MTHNSFRFDKTALTLATVVILIASACGNKKTPIPPPPPSPVASSPTAAPSGPGIPVIAEFSVEPSAIERGQSAVLRWNVTGANNVAIDNGFGTVPPSGTQRVTPAPAAPPAPVTRNRGPIGTLEGRVQSDLRDALFDYDSNNIRDDARAALTGDFDALKRILADFPNAIINVEGHCDERGSAEYNLGLGDRRASSARDFLTQLGVPADRLKTISYGKERPVCTESDESCWQRNRRAHFSVGQ